MKRILIACFFTLWGVSAWAQPKEIKIEVDGIEIEMVRVDPGTVAVPPRSGYTMIKDPSTGKFVMSYKDPSTGKYVYPDGSIVNIPGNTETISEPFYICKYPLLNAQWGQTGKKAPYPHTGLYYDKDKGDRNPEHIAWFLEKLNKKTCLHFDLPRLSEWLLACGPVPDDYENYAWTDGAVHPAGQKLPNAIGAYDMLGNVAEMVKQDSYVKGDKMIVEYPRYVGGVPQLGSKYIRKDPSRLLELRTTAPETSMYPPGFRLILKGVPQDCPGKIFTRIFEENGKKGVETEYGVILKPEFDEVQLVEVDPEMALENGYFYGKDGKWGIVDRKGQALIPMVLKRKLTQPEVDAVLGSLHLYSYRLARKARIEELKTTKGEYEKTADFEARQANPALQEAYVNEQMQGFEEVFVQRQLHNWKGFGIVFMDYDADKEAFPFQLSGIPSGSWVTYYFPVPIADAPAFKEYVRSAAPKDILEGFRWGVVDDILQPLRGMILLPDGRSFSF